MRTEPGTKTESGSLWQESMRIGLPELDQERRNVIELLELLRLRPRYSIASEVFVSRFGVVQEACDKFIRYEERLLNKYSVPEAARRLHFADHERFRAKLSEIHRDSMRKKNHTALDVYRSLRNDIERHVLTFGIEMSKHIPDAERSNCAIDDTERAVETT